MDLSERNQEQQQQPPSPPSKNANKRLKVGRACYTCRAKKIKVSIQKIR
jgi:hypothetical protein